MSLAALEIQVHSDLLKLGHDIHTWNSDTWVRPRQHDEGHIYDVVIVGGGQSGMGAAFGLLRERVSNILVIDENPQGFEGPWETYARMMTLRTPKNLTSIDLGVPSLTFRAYWEAQHGAEAWHALGKIPRSDWMAYLRWYRQVLNLPVVNQVRLQLIEPMANGIHRLHVDGQGAAQGSLFARKVILATGIQGGGQWHVPPMIVDNLTPDRYAHTSAMIDFQKLRGKRIAILGGGASAFDNAHHALTLGVAEAHVFIRRPELPRINPIRHMEATGLIARFGSLQDADKYAIMSSFFKLNQPPTNDTFERAAACPGFQMHLGSPWESVKETDDGVQVSTPTGSFHFDFVVFSTGLVTDPALRPELSLVEKEIVRWGERYQAPEAIANPLIDAHPYLNSGFAFEGRSEAGRERLHGLFSFNYSALISFGLSASALSGLKFAIPKLVQGVADQLLLDDRDVMLHEYHAYDEPEFVGVWPRKEAK